MALQTTYNDTQTRFVLGMIPDMRTPGQDVSRNVEDAAGIGFGRPVFQGTADRQIKGVGDRFIGLTVLDTTQLQDSYPQYATARVRTKGPVVVAAPATVTAGAPAYVTSAGALSVTEGSNTRIGSFETSGNSGDLVVLNLV